MEAASRTDRDPLKPATAPASGTAAVMDREFIEKHQIVERYLAGKLPPRGAADFERFCRENPDLLDGIGLAPRVNAALRLLEAGGQPEPWQESKPRPWQKPGILIGAGVLALVLLITSAVLLSRLSDLNARIASLQKRVAEQPLEPMTSTRPVHVIPSRNGPSASAAVTVGGTGAQFADLKFDLAWARYTQYQVTIDREGQGRVAILHAVARDSNGELRIAFNTSALGPGLYHFTIEGLNWQGKPEPAAWVSIAVDH
jgi:hypothetical protein